MDLFSYKGSQSYQPLSVRWAEQDLVAYSEFRDGNVPAAFQNLEVFQKSLEVLPQGVQKVYLRSDTAAYQKDLLIYCAKGQNKRFGVIEFAIGADVTAEFRKAVGEVAEEDWQTLKRVIDGRQVETGQEWAEVCFVPSWIVSKNGPTYRFIATRELLRQQEFPGMEVQLPFPTYHRGEKHYKLHGLVTNRDIAGDQLIWWSRERCGKGEEMHSIMKSDLAGGQFPSAQFGANAAWWQIMILAFNLNSLMKSLALPENWGSKRLKALRFGLIHQAGRVVQHARQLAIRLSRNNPVYSIFLGIRQRLRDIQIATGAPNTV
jgi:Transposase DDE domain group 1